MVAGDRRDHRHWISDEIHDGLLPRGNFGWSGADARATLSAQRMVLGWDGAGIFDLPAESGVAGAAWIYFAALSRAHPRPRCAAGASGWIPTPSVLGLHEYRYGAVVDRGIT